MVVAAAWQIEANNEKLNLNALQFMRYRNWSNTIFQNFLGILIRVDLNFSLDVEMKRKFLMQNVYADRVEQSKNWKNESF